MGTLRLFSVQIAIALLLLTQAKSTTTKDMPVHPNNTSTSCIADERYALVTFREGLSDPANLLSSWKGDDCCRWKGVKCSNKTGHVIRLDLQGPDCDNSEFSIQLRNSPDSLQVLNLTSLEELDLSGNHFHKRGSPNWFWDLTSLKSLDISSNAFYGPFPHEIGNLTSMVNLDLSSTDLVGMIPSNMKNLCNLEGLFFYESNINGSIEEFFQRLPSCSWNKLQTLDLYNCNLTGHLPAMLSPITNLLWLDLSSNQLTGELTKLTRLSMESNNLDGVIYEGHLSRLNMLEELTLSGNSIAIIVSPTWVPPFSLRIFELRNCQLGPKFPAWLRWQTHLNSLDISNTSISDMVPDWFWVLASSVQFLNIRDNRITGVLPSTMEFMRGEIMDFSSNQLSGPIPKLPMNLTNLNISKNSLVGLLPLDIGAPRLETLVLYGNYISGTIPSYLCKLQLLTLLDISENNLTGLVLDCQDNKSTTNMTSLSILNLSLRNNNLSGDFPSFLQNCKKLIFLDLSYNKFSGNLPTWIRQKLPSLVFLRLRSNMFYGHIPEELTLMFNLQYLDLAYNNLTGSIPRSIGNYKGMIQRRDGDDGFEYAFQQGSISIDGNEMVEYSENFKVVTKGQERLYTGEVIYMVNLDLSCNNLIGEIPEEIATLVELKSLNLSWNTFSGKIPEMIGALVQVESLDLSHNELSGEIPTSLSALTSLSRLNMSYNNLSGMVPSGNQLQSLEDPLYIYIGNPGLCGPPLPRNCSHLEPIPANQELHEDVVSFFIAMGSGYVIALWVVFCTFLFKRKWRVSWFSHCDSLYDQVYVLVAVTWASLTRRNA
uniref:Uncharacterized protein n=1 Tax=Avena sativa TaxID=4498 RepID=A0ACD5VDL0_AVESA